MRLLFDTHAVLWWMLDDKRLPNPARKVIESRETSLFFSPVNVYELAYKARLGKLDLHPTLVDDLGGQMTAIGLLELPITASHAAKAAALGIDHRDPFDRLIIAQALSEKMTLVSKEKLFDRSGVKRLWA